MRNLLAFMAAMAITVGVVGWYLNWYQVRSLPAASGQRSLSIDINTGKIGEDLQKGTTELQHMLDKNSDHKETAPPAANQAANR